MTTLSDQTTLVTGANRGLGREFVDQFLARGAAKVYAAARDQRSITMHDPYPTRCVFGRRGRFAGLRSRSTTPPHRCQPHAIEPPTRTPGFVEKRRDRHNYLLSELTRRFGPLDELPVSVVVRRGEAGAVTGLVLDELAAWGQPILGIFDSWGNVNVPLTLVQRIAHNPASEVITTFGPNWFSRRETLDTEQLDAVFGGRDR